MKQLRRIDFTRIMRLKKEEVLLRLVEPQAAIKFQNPQQFQLDLFFLQGTVVSTEHIGIEGKKTRILKTFVNLKSQ